MRDTYYERKRGHHSERDIEEEHAEIKEKYLFSMEIVMGRETKSRATQKVHKKSTARETQQ